MMDRFLMFRSAARPLSRHLVAQGSRTRHFHTITTDFITQDTTGNLVCKKVPVFIGNPGEAYVYVLISPSVGETFRDASSTAATQDRCKLSFFHDTRHFGLRETPSVLGGTHIDQESESNTSPATIFLSGKMHEIVIDGTDDAEFAEHASASGQNLKPVLDQLEHM